MSTYSHGAMVNELTRDEGLRLRPYLDTVGKTTIGVGRNLTDRGITRAEADVLLANDVGLCELDLDSHVSWWRLMTDARQRGLLNMCFNLGWPTLATFRTTLGHLQAGRYDDASTTVLQSKWATQVGMRAVRISEQFRVG